MDDGVVASLRRRAAGGRRVGPRPCLALAAGLELACAGPRRRLGCEGPPAPALPLGSLGRGQTSGC
eukprot:12674146-Alexandrium_andersonii.AAC.1